MEDASSRPTPRQSANRQTIGTGSRRKDQRIGVLVSSLGDQAGVADNAGQRQAGRLAEIAETDDADQEIERVIRDVRAKQGREHHILHQHGQQGVQKAPHDTQNRTLVLGLEVPGNQLLDQKTIPLERVDDVQHRARLSQQVFPHQASAAQRQKNESRGSQVPVIRSEHGFCSGPRAKAQLAVQTFTVQSDTFRFFQLGFHLAAGCQESVSVIQRDRIAGFTLRRRDAKTQGR